MLKKRVIACLVIKDGKVVQSIGFDKFLPIGRVDISVEFLNRWGIDEIVLLDIDATRDDRKPNFKLITEVSKNSFAPLTVGGGIKNLQDIKNLIRYGADKISINTLAIEKPEIITRAAEIFGNQCIVVSIDVKKHKNRYEVFLRNGKKPTGLEVVEWARKIEALGAGEIFLNSIDKDGSKSGYDLRLIKMVSDAVSIPVIACGGAGHPDHFLQVFKKTGALASAAGNFFQFTEHSPIIVKSYLLENKIDVRLDSHANYKGINFLADGRIGKRSDDYLRKLRFEYILDEVI